MPTYMVNSIVVVFFYRLQPITTDLISKMHEKSLALTLFSKLCQCKGPPKLPKTSLTHEPERQTDAGDATITSYIMTTSTSSECKHPKSRESSCDRLRLLGVKVFVATFSQGFRVHASSM